MNAYQDSSSKTYVKPCCSSDTEPILIIIFLVSADVMSAPPPHPKKYDTFTKLGQPLILAAALRGLEL